MDTVSVSNFMDQRGPVEDGPRTVTHPSKDGSHRQTGWSTRSEMAVLAGSGFSEDGRSPSTN
jgi:hypothetical protein